LFFFRRFFFCPECLGLFDIFWNFFFQKTGGGEGGGVGGGGGVTRLWNYMPVYSSVQGINSHEGAGAHVQWACWGHLVSKYWNSKYVNSDA